MRALLVVLAALLLGGSAARAQTPAPSQHASPAAWQRYAREVLQQLIEMRTAPPAGTTEAANAMAKRLLEAGFPESDVQVIGPTPQKGNLVARLHGRKQTEKPLLLMAHLDVVEARREDWSFDPFILREQDGYFYGRGTSDDKGMAAIFVSALARMKTEGIAPDRDVILILTAGEEGGGDNGVIWLLRQHPQLVDAAFALNEGGGGSIVEGRRAYLEVQAAEKVYLSFRLEARNPGGHSSVPVPDNAIYRLAGALTRLAAYQFPAKPNEITRRFFQTLLHTELNDTTIARVSRETAYYNAMLRTTCVATMLQGGHAANALPQMARATVNCRLLPGEEPAEVQRTLQQVVADDGVTVSPMGGASLSQASPLRDDVMGAVERTTRDLWPGVPVLPVMSTGATDGRYLRNAGIPVYGISGLFEDIDDSRAHGRDERLLVQSFYEGQEFLWRLIQALASTAPPTT